MKISRPKLIALIKLENLPDANTQLKRLSLFFDEIRYILPVFPPVIKETLSGPGKRIEECSFVKRISDDSFDVSDFNFFRDTSTFFKFTKDNLGPELLKTLEVFEEAGIAKENSIGDEQKESYKKFNEKRDDLIILDINDRTFNELSETNPNDYDIFNKVKYVTLKGSDPKAIYSEFTIGVIEEPNSIADSRDITDILITSHISSMFPVFLNPRHRREVSYRYEQFIKGVQVLKETHPSLGSSMKTKSSLGEVAFNVANSIFTSELIEGKNAKQIVKYRNALYESRNKYMHKDLMEITSLIEGNPWDQNVSDEVNKYIIGKLSNDLQTFDEESQRVWEKLFGSITVRLAEVSQSSVLGGSVGGLIGNVIPHATTWELVLYGAIAGAVKSSPKLIKTLVDCIIDIRKVKKNFVAFLGKFK